MANTPLSTESEKDPQYSYTDYGLIFDDNKEAFFYNNKEVGLFIDKKGKNKYYFYTNPNAKLRIKTVRNNNGDISSIEIINDDEYNKLAKNNKELSGIDWNNWISSEDNTDNNAVHADYIQLKDKLTVNEALNEINKYFESILSDKKVCKGKYIIEISDNEIYNKLKIQIFNVTTTSGVVQSFLVTSKEERFDKMLNSYKTDKCTIIPLGGGVGSIGIENYYLYDIDNDNEEELIYIYSFGSGLNYTVINCIDDGEIIESIIDFKLNIIYDLELVKNELVLKSKDKKLGVIKLFSKEGNKRVLILEK
jgi:hypothetical protein